MRQTCPFNIWFVFPSCFPRGPFEKLRASAKTSVHGEHMEAFKCFYQSADEPRLNSRSGHIIQTSVVLVSPSVSAGDAARCQLPVRNAGNASRETLTILENENKERLLSVCFCQTIFGVNFSVQ